MLSVSTEIRARMALECDLEELAIYCLSFARRDLTAALACRYGKVLLIKS